MFQWEKVKENEEGKKKSIYQPAASSTTCATPQNILQKSAKDLQFSWTSFISYALQEFYLEWLLHIV